MMPSQDQQPSPSGSPGGPQQPTPPPRQRLLFWWVILTALLLWNLSVFWGKTTAEQTAEIPYTTFLAQVRAGNVAEISLQAENIIGKFEKPIVWPPRGEKAPGAANERSAAVTPGSQTGGTVGGATAAPSPAPAATEKAVAATAKAPTAEAAPSAATKTGAAEKPSATPP